MLVSWFSPSGGSAALWRCLSAVTTTLSPSGASRLTSAPGAEPRPTAATQRTGFTGPGTAVACSLAWSQCSGVPTITAPVRAAISPPVFAWSKCPWPMKIASGASATSSFVVVGT